MMTPATTEPRLMADGCDGLLALALGALSLSQRFADLTVERDRSPLDGNDPLLLAALGVVSVRRSLARWLAEAAGPPRDSPVVSPTPPPHPRELLR